MAENRIQVNCLVQVLGNNELDFAEWLDYHIALGFDTIFVFDSGSHEWLPNVCTRRHAHVELVPVSDAPEGKWEYKSDIISTYVSRRKVSEWCVCLEDNEFIWLNLDTFHNIRGYVGSMPGQAMSCTLYYKVMSSHEPTRYRVGTQIDCFTHVRREPEGFIPEYKFLPNGGVTMFRIASLDMPLADPVVPRVQNGWVDAMFRRMTYQRYTDEIASRKFSPTAYPARVYKFGIRSGVEMGFKDDAVPQGFDLLDLSMQRAREALIRVPVNPETERLFAKMEPAPQMAIVEASNGEKVEVDADRAAELNLPISSARVDKMILMGKYFEDICDYVATKDPGFDRDALARMFDRERDAIIKTSLPYTELQEMIDAGASDADILKKLVLTPATLERMKVALPVLDIHTGATKEEYSPSSPDGIDIKIAAEVDKFNGIVSKGAMTPEQQAAVGEALDKVEHDHHGGKKSSKTAKKPPKKPFKKPAKPSSDPAPEVQPATESTQVETADDTGINMDETNNLLASVNLDAIIANVEANHDAT